MAQRMDAINCVKKIVEKILWCAIGIQIDRRKYQHGGISRAKEMARGCLICIRGGINFCLTWMRLISTGMDLL